MARSGKDGKAGGAGPRMIQGAILSTVLASALWGASFPISRNALTFIDPYSLALARFAVAVLSVMVLLAVVFRPEESAVGGSRENLGTQLKSLLKSPIIWALGVLNAMGFLFQNMALLTTTAINVSLLVNVNVVVVAVMSVAFIGERLGVRGTAGIIMGAGGVILLTTKGDPSMVSRGSFVGDMYGLAAGLVWSAYIVLTKVALDRKRESIPPLAGDPLGLVAGVSTATAASLVIPWLLLSPAARGGLAGAASMFTMPALPSVLYLGIFSVVIAFYLWHLGLKSLPAWVSSLVLLCEVMFAAVIAMLWLGERLGVAEAAGGLLIVVGILLAQKSMTEGESGAKPP